MSRNVQGVLIIHSNEFRSFVKGDPAAIYRQIERYYKLAEPRTMVVGAGLPEDNLTKPNLIVYETVADWKESVI